MSHPNPGYKATTFRLPVELVGRLEATAKERDLSQNRIMARALEEYLDRLIPVEEALATKKGSS